MIGHFHPQPEAVCSWMPIRYTVLERDNCNLICQIGYLLQVSIDSCMVNRRSSARVRFPHRKRWKLLSTVKSLCRYSHICAGRKKMFAQGFYPPHHGCFTCIFTRATFYRASVFTNFERATFCVVKTWRQAINH